MNVFDKPHRTSHVPILVLILLAIYSNPMLLDILLENEKNDKQLNISRKIELYGSCVSKN